MKHLAVLMNAREHSAVKVVAALFTFVFAFEVRNVAKHFPRAIVSYNWVVSGFKAIIFGNEFCFHFV